MGRVYKYEIKYNDSFTIRMPSKAQVLSVDTQDETPCIWALVNLDEEPEERRFYLRGTGHPAEGLEHKQFVGTFLTAGGRLVFHLWTD